MPVSPMPEGATDGSCPAHRSKDGKSMVIRVIIAAHKAYRMPEDPMYLPLQVGKAGKPGIGWQGDDTGENISEKNANWCELTGLYWAWRNLPCDALGLVHYRRHFMRARFGGDKWARVLRREDAERALAECPILLPMPRHYLIESTYSQYAHAHHARDLDVTRTILAERHPAFVPSFDRCMRMRGGHRFNMFLMRRDLADEYCAWLFDVLFELEKRLDLSGYSKNDARVFGFVSERLLDVWLDANRYPYRDLPYAFMEKQNWIRKGGSFLARKFLRTR